MTGFSEKTTVQRAIVDLLIDAGWQYVPGSQLPRTSQSVIIETDLRAAVERFNPAIANQPDRVDAVVARVRQTILAVADDGLIAANEVITEWLRGRETITLSDTNRDEPVQIIDFSDPFANRLVVSDEVTYGAGTDRVRFDIVLWVNGLPLVVGETKTPVNSSKTWVNAAVDITESYEPNHSHFFVPNLLSFATEGKDFRYAPVATPLNLWERWGDSKTDPKLDGWERVRLAVEQLLHPSTVLKFLEHYALFDKAVSDGAARTMKILPRYFQFETVEALVNRATTGPGRQGLIYHTQGSGKTLAMAWAATRLVMDERMKNPTVIVVADRTQLVTQTYRQFASAGATEPVKAASKEALQGALRRDARGIIVTTVHKFDNAGHLSDRDNIVILVDEAHRTQEGTLGQQMRDALPNALRFGFTGTPIADLTRNTFKLFGDEGDPDWSLSTYNSDRSISDGTTVPMLVIPRPVSFHISKDKLDEEFDTLTQMEGLDDDEKEFLAQRLSKVRTLLANPARIRAVVADLVDHFYASVDPLGLKAQIVVGDQDLCVAYEKGLREVLAGRGTGDECAVVISAQGKSDLDSYKLSDAQEEALLDRFRRYGDPLKFLIVTAKLGTGFNAPIEGVLYLDKPMKLHTLFQTITRTNRPWAHPETGQPKEYGLIVDYIGLGDGFARAMAPANPVQQQKRLDIDGLIPQFEAILSAALGRFVGIDRTRDDHTTLLHALERVPAGPYRDDFIGEFLAAQALWETVSPDSRLTPYRDDYRFVSQVFQALPQADDGRELLWARLGAKSRELVYQHMRDVQVFDRMLTVPIADADTIKTLVETGQLPEPDPEERGKSSTEIVDSIMARIRRRLDGPSGVGPVYRSIAERLDQLRQQELDRAEASIEWLTQLFKVSADLYEAEQADDAGLLDDLPDPRIGMLTRIFEENRPRGSTVLVSEVVQAVDELVRRATFDGWTSKEASKKAVRKELRKLFQRFKLPLTGEPLESAWAYILKHY